MTWMSSCGVHSGCTYNAKSVMRLHKASGGIHSCQIDCRLLGPPNSAGVITRASKGRGVRSIKPDLKIQEIMHMWY